MGLRQPHWISCNSKETGGCPVSHGPEWHGSGWGRAGTGEALWWRRKASATVACLNLQPRTREDATGASRCQHLHRQPPAPVSFQHHSGQIRNSSELTYNLEERGGSRNDLEDQKWLRLRVCYLPEGRLDVEMRFRYGRFKKITFATQLSSWPEIRTPCMYKLSSQSLWISGNMRYGGKTYWLAQAFHHNWPCGLWQISGPQSHSYKIRVMARPWQ